MELSGTRRGAGLRANATDVRRAQYLRTKRAVDCVFSLFLLFLGIPVLAAIALAIKCESGGPVLFRQNRIGQYGRPFTILKFRSMSTLSPRYSYKVPLADPRITLVGRFLRRSGLDELPQLWNVIRGDMSLIGPRPELPFIVDQYRPVQHLRHSVRPGLTGWWQIHQRNAPETMEQDSADPSHLSRMAYDLYYLDHMSFSMDFLIAVRTIGVIFKCLMPSQVQRPFRPEAVSMETNAEVFTAEASVKS